MKSKPKVCDGPLPKFVEGYWPCIGFRAIMNPSFAHRDDAHAAMLYSHAAGHNGLWTDTWDQFFHVHLLPMMEATRRG